MKKLILFLSLQLLYCAAWAGNGKITGRVIDKTTGESLIGVSVVIAGTTTGAATDLDGRYTISVAPGTYTILTSFVSYNTQKTEGVVVTDGKVTTLNVVLEEASNSLQEIEIVAKFQRESFDALILERRKSAVISDGVSAELIRKTPDRNTGDVLRRVSGASIQDNKFAIIRGLNDRYNSAFINGAPLLSSEPDRKAFAFDIFPANLVESVVIAKTATPDLPADFAGGMIQIKTRDIPDENFYSASVGANYNSITTFKPYYSGPKSGTDWIGLDNGLRGMPAGIPSDAGVKQLINDYKSDELNALAAQLPNTWKPQRSSAMRPGTSLQFAAGHRFGKFGSMTSITYNDTYRYRQTTRRDYENGKLNLDFTNDQYSRNVLAGLLWNLAYKLDDNHKFGFKNLYNINSTDQTIFRNGEDYGTGLRQRGTAFWFTENKLMTNQFTGEHYLPETRMKINWNVGHNDIRRDVPDLRRITYIQPIDNPDGVGFTVPFSSSVQPEYGGRFYSKLKEKAWSYSADVQVPIYENVNLKTGVYRQTRDRQFAGRQLGYVRGIEFNSNLSAYALDSIFTGKNIGDKGFSLGESTVLSDHYAATSTLNAAFLMGDATLGKFRMVGGLRVESYNQTLTAYKPGETNPELAPSVNTDVTVTDWLPSLNVVYGLTAKSNLRASLSQTVSRPEFRELAPFQFYDFNDLVIVQGTPEIKRTKINNYDLRYEYYPGAGQIISVSLFYKQFNNPIEKTLEPAGSLRLMSFRNVAKANNYGVEFDVRQNLVRLDPTVKLFERLTVFGNLSLIGSKVDLDTLKAMTGEGSRPMQGQSSYIINGGISYADEEHLFDINLSVNRVGRRIANVGNADYASLWENPRTVLDLQLSKSFSNRMEFKINFSDILRQNLVLYQDNDQNKKLDRSKDNILFDTKMGRNVSVTFNYKF